MLVEWKKANVTRLGPMDSILKPGVNLLEEGAVDMPLANSEVKKFLDDEQVKFQIQKGNLIVLVPPAKEGDAAMIKKLTPEKVVEIVGNCFIPAVLDFLESADGRPAVQAAIRKQRKELEPKTAEDEE
jgi:hypothetical protein